ncbi:MAG: hypothetical protein ING36_06095, partial [Burkholderiales bacterium]|nr:hypothetical protein [Burkholderiales bacterium]
MKKNIFPKLLTALLWALAGVSATPLAQAQRASNAGAITISLPNGYANLRAEDLRLMSTAGEVRWVRVWDGQEWKFQPQWESLSTSFKNLTGSQSADTSTGAVAGTPTLASGSGGGGSSGCWVWVDEDWQPTAGAALLPVRSTPFNRVIGQNNGNDYLAAASVSVDYAALCPGASALNSTSSFRQTEGIRRINELYLGEGGRYAFNNRSILEKRAVQQLPTAATASLTSQLASGRITLSPQTNAKGFR